MCGLSASELREGPVWFPQGWVQLIFWHETYVRIDFQQLDGKLLKNTTYCSRDVSHGTGLGCQTWSLVYDPQPHRKGRDPLSGSVCECVCVQDYSPAPTFTTFSSCETGAPALPRLALKWCSSLFELWTPLCYWPWPKTPRSAKIPF